jgi:putrescine transport system permease protein
MTGKSRHLVLAIPWAWLILLLILPALIVVKIAFSYPADSVPPYAPMLQSDGVHISTDAFALILSDPLYARALLLSLKVAGLSTAICLLAGYPMALAIARSSERWRSLLLMLVMLPFWTGFLMRINAWIGLLQDDGWINTIVIALSLSPLGLLYTDTAMYIGIVYTYLPFMVLPLYARLRSSTFDCSKPRRISGRRHGGCSSQ